MDRRTFLKMGLKLGLLTSAGFGIFEMAKLLLNEQEYNAEQDYFKIFKISSNESRCINDNGNSVISGKDTDVLQTMFGRDNTFIHVRSGKYIIEKSLRPANNVSFIGDGMFHTIITSLLGVNLGPGGLITNYSKEKNKQKNNPVKNVTISDIQLDGSNFPSDSYSKGIYFAFCDRLKLRNIYCHHTTATGIGPDFLTDSEITGCIADHCGTRRGKNEGSNGIGIGTGRSFDIEYEHSQPLMISDCVCSNNYNHGIVIEGQSNKYEGYYTNVINCTLHDNGVTGIEVDGGYRTSIIGCSIYRNKSNGVSIGNTSFNLPSKDIIVNANEIYDNSNAPVNIEKDSDRIIITNNIGGGNVIKDIRNLSKGIAIIDNNIFYDYYDQSVK